MKKCWILVLLACGSPAVRAATVALGPDPVANSAMLASAISKANAGDTVQLPAGKFPIGQSIQLRSNVALAGVDPAHTTLLAALTAPGPMIAGSGVTSVEIDNFTLDGNGNANVTQGIALSNSKSLSLHGLTIQNLIASTQSTASLGPHAIDCTSSVTASTFNGITAKQIGLKQTWGGGIRLSWGSSGNTVSNCSIDGTGRGGIFCNDGSTDNVILSNIVAHSGGVGLGIEVQNCDRSLIQNNRIDHWLSVDNSSQSAVRGNMICSVDGTYKLCGIEIVDSHDVIVAQNVVTGGAKVGLSISGPNPKLRMLFSSNLFEGASTWGAQIEGDAGGAADLVFDANRFIKTRVGPSPLYANQGHGVRLNGNCQSIAFVDNEIAHNTGVGIQITGDNVSQLVFAGNSVLDNDGGTIDADVTPHLTWKQNHAVPLVAAWDRASENATIPTLTVQVSDSPAIKQAVQFSATPPAGFQASAWLWDFGDGLPSVNAQDSHVYAHSGANAVTVTSWDANGNVAIGKSSIIVSP